MSSFRPALSSHIDNGIQGPQADAIIKATGYRDDYGLSVINFSPSEHSKVQSSILTDCIHPAMNLGVLDQLPMEILLQTLRQMDMQTLFHLRQVNARGRQLVDSLKEYRAVVSHGLTAFCALLRTKLATHVTLLDFYRVLCAKNCSFCGKFGGFVFLPTWIRCCFECIEEDPETRMVTVGELRRLFRLSRTELTQQKSFQTLPGIYTTGLYSMHQSHWKQRIKIVPHFPAMELFGDRSDLVAQTKDRLFWDPTHNFMASCELPFYNSKSREIECGIACAGCKLGPPQGQWQGKIFGDVYSRDEFLKHLNLCYEAKRILWDSGFINALGLFSRKKLKNPGRFLLRDRSATF